MARPIKIESTLPFPPYGQFISFMDDLQALGVLPNRINPSVFKTSFSGSAVNQILRALRFFELIDADGVPNAAGLSPLMDPATRSESLKSLLERKYAGLIALPLATAGPAEVNKWFGEQGMDPVATRKAKAFFLSAGKENGIAMHSLVADKAPRRGPRGKRRVRKATPSDSVEEGSNGTAPQQPQVLQVLFHPAIDAYLRAAKELIDGEGWDKAARDRVVQGFETQLDLFLPVKK